MPPTYYRGCWHVVSRGLFPRYRPLSSLGKGVYNPKAFILHATSLGQAFAHCPRFPAAASRRSGGRVSVPLWLVILSDQLPVIGLVSHYLTNYLIGREPLLWRIKLSPINQGLPVLCGIIPSFPRLIHQVPSYLFPDKRSLQLESILPPRGVAASGFRPLRNIPRCCLP